MYKYTDNIKEMGAGLIDGTNISLRWVKELLQPFLASLEYRVYMWI